VANYRNTVLTAFQEVEDNLAALHRLEEASVSEAAAVTATGRAMAAVIHEALRAAIEAEPRPH
jgi:outer membrane protein TolC